MVRIYRVSPRILGSPLLCPGDLEQVRSMGVVHVVILVEEFELDCWPGIREYFDALNDRGLGYTWFPIPDGEAPSDPDEVLKLFNELRRVEGLGGILFHCYGGTGRTPMMIAAYLVTVHGLSLEEAFEALRRAGAYIDLTSEQLVFLEMMDRFYRGALKA